MIRKILPVFAAAYFVSCAGPRHLPIGEVADNGGCDIVGKIPVQVLDLYGAPYTDCDKLRFWQKGLPPSFANAAVPRIINSTYTLDSLVSDWNSGLTLKDLQIKLGVN